MTEDDEAIDDAVLEQQEAEMRALLRRAPAPLPEHDAVKPPDLLPAVQRKIRQRSRGKFYGDGWSTSQDRVSYLVIALLMLLVVGVAYLALGPTGFASFR